MTVVDIHCDDAVTEEERLEIEFWADTHDPDNVSTIVVGARGVAVHSLAVDGLSHSYAVAGTAVRHGDVVAELDEALTVMRRARNI